MKSTSVYIGGISVKEDEIKMVGELLIASYNAHKYDQLTKKVKQDGALGKHSAYLKKAKALEYEAEQHRLLSALYESSADRPDMTVFLDEVFDLLK